MASHKSALDQIDQLWSCYIGKIWKGEVVFKVDIGGYGVYQNVNICDYISPFNKFGIDKLYVDKFEYPPPAAGLKNMPKDDPTWKNCLKISREQHMKEDQVYT